MDVLQKHYPPLEVDTREKDIVQIWQKGKQTVDVILIERERIRDLIELLEKQSNSLF